jgi:hypothetical protein
MTASEVRNFVHDHVFNSIKRTWNTHKQIIRFSSCYCVLRCSALCHNGKTSGIPRVSGARGSKACRRSPSGAPRRGAPEEGARCHITYKTCFLAFSCVLMPFLALPSGARGGRPPLCTPLGKTLWSGYDRTCIEASVVSL